MNGLLQVVLIYSLQSTRVFRYMGGLLSSLATMLHLELPHINVLTKMDLAK